MLDLHALEIAGEDNLVAQLDGSQLAKIASQVMRDYNEDMGSMRDHLETVERGMKLVRQDYEKRSEPWDGAANTKMPLILNAAIKFAAEATGELLRGDELVKTADFGKPTDEKEARSERVRKRMNFQYRHELPDWEDDHEKLILEHSIRGNAFKKYYFNREKGREICELITTGVIINDNTKSLEDDPRISLQYSLKRFEVEEKLRSGSWEEIKLPAYNDDAKDEDFIEQLARIDLDGDGYPERYIVQMHLDSQQIPRIAPNFTEDSVQFSAKDSQAYAKDIAKAEMSMQMGEEVERPDPPQVMRIDTAYSRIRYIKYGFVPNFGGGFWDYGWAYLLGPLNENVNELANQLLNAGHLSNTQGGFLSSMLRIKKGEARFRPGEWKTVQAPGSVLKDAILPLPAREPSNVLYLLMGFLVEQLKELSSVTAVMSGEQPRANMAAASVMALIEQGKKTFGFIYRRHWRSLKKEFNALYDLNFQYEDPQWYQDFHDDPQADPKKDFTRAGIDLLPTANPEFSSRVQRMAEAEALMPLKDDPRANGGEIIRKYVEVITDDKEQAAMLVPESPNMTPDQVAQHMEILKQQMIDSLEVREKEAKAQIAETNLEMAALELMLKTQMAPFDVQRAVQATMKSIEATEKARHEADKAESDASVPVSN